MLASKWKFVSHLRILTDFVSVSYNSCPYVGSTFPKILYSVMEKWSCNENKKWLKCICDFKEI